MARSVFVLLSFVLVLSACADIASAETYTVSPDGLGDFPTIQAAVDAAGFTDGIFLTDGTFTGDGNRDIVVPSETIYIQSESGNPTACIFDCEGSARDEHRGFHFTSVGEGFATLGGIGIVNVYVSGHGGGIWAEGASPSITRCTIAMCTAGTTNRGGGLYVSDGGKPSIFMTTFASNEAGYGGGIAVCQSTFVCQQSVINDNETFSEDGAGIAVDEGDEPLVTCCDVHGNADGNYDATIGDLTGVDENFSENPLFCGLMTENYWLDAASPCLPGGNGCGFTIGVLGQGCDSLVEATSWERIKAIWR